MVDALTRWPSLSSSPLDPLVSPAVVLGGEPLDQRGDLGADRRPPYPVRAFPLAGDQAALPAQDGAGRDQPAHPPPSRQEPDQGGEDGEGGAGDSPSARFSPSSPARGLRHRTARPRIPDAGRQGGNGGRGRSQEPGTRGNLIRGLEASFGGPEGRMTLRWPAQPGRRHPGIAGDADEGQGMAGGATPFRQELNYGYIFLEIYC